MTVYLLPPVVETTDILAICKRSNVPFENFATIRELLLKPLNIPVVIGTIRPQDLLVLNRYAPTLVEELPTVVISAPGAVYNGDWMALASALPAMDWRELETKLSKSGHTAYEGESLVKRNLGSPAFETLEGPISLPSRSSQSRPLTRSKPVEQDEEDFLDAQPE